jgi:hypothetical protein
MFKRTIIGIFVSAFIFGLIATAQEARLAGDVFAWFPEGVYRDLAFSDKVKMAESPLYTMFKEILENAGGERYESRNPLPDSVKNAVESQTSGSLLKLGVPAAHHESHVDEADVGEEEELHESATLLWVFRFADVEGALKEAVDAGSIAPIGLRINKRPVYSMNARKSEESQKAFYAYATLTNELLVAEDLELLKLMIKTGMGLELGLLDDTEYADMLRYVAILSQSWAIKPEKVMLKWRIEKAQDDEKMAASVERWRQDLETGPQYRIENFDFGDEAVAAQEMQVYKTDEYAEAAGGKTRQDLDNAQAEIPKNVESLDKEKKLTDREKRVANKALGFASDLLGSIETTVEDNIVSTTVLFTKQQLNSLNSIIKMAKAFEKAQKKQEEEK